MKKSEIKEKKKLREIATAKIATMTVMTVSDDDEDDDDDEIIPNGIFHYVYYKINEVATTCTQT